MLHRMGIGCNPSKINGKLIRELCNAVTVYTQFRWSLRRVRDVKTKISCTLQHGVGGDSFRAGTCRSYNPLEGTYT